MMDLQVHKFGGGVLDRPLAMQQLVKIAESFKGTPTVIVVSALGKTTNALENLASCFLNREDMEPKLAEVQYFHYEFLNSLFVNTANGVFEQTRSDLEGLRFPPVRFRSTERAMTLDYFTSKGEIMSSRIVSSYLCGSGISNDLINATDFVCTDSNFGQAKVYRRNTRSQLQSLVLQALKKTGVVVTQGFIGKSVELDAVTTLGREGSDYTAGLIGDLLRAKSVTLWKDVPGIMTRDPNGPRGGQAELMSVLSYRECARYLRGSAKGLIHPKTLKVVAKAGIPLQVRPFWNPEYLGSIVC